MAIRADDCYSCAIPVAAIRRLVSSGSIATPVRVFVVGDVDPAIAAFFARHRIPVQVEFGGTLEAMATTRAQRLPFLVLSSDRRVLAVHSLPITDLRIPSP
jgi:hypothetical protein